MSVRPNISIAMATYNGEAYLRAQLDSLATQTLSPLELQIGDDGSTDRTEKIIRDFAETAPFPVVLTRNAKRLGYADNFIRTAQRCNGEYIAFCDQDDIWFANKISRISQVLVSNRTLNFVSHAVLVADNDAMETGHLYQTATNPGATYENLKRPLLWSTLGWTQVFSRRLLEFDPSDRAPSPFKDVDPFPHDSWIALLANLLGGVIEIDEPLGVYRRHEGTLTQAGKSSVACPSRLIGSAEYAALAECCDEIATVFNRHAHRIQNHQMASAFEIGHASYRRYAEVLRMRAYLYEADTLRTRLRTFTRILLYGGYRGESRRSLRRRSALKDLAHSLSLRSAIKNLQQ